MSDQEDGERRIADLNLLGRVVYLAGQSIRVTGDLFEAVAKLAADTYKDAERAFLQGIDPNIDDADIVEEHRQETKRD